MAQVKAVFSGAVVAEPETRQVGDSTVLEFPVYVNHSKKDRSTGEYVPTGDTTKIRVTLWPPMSESTDVLKGDVVEISGTLVEKEFKRKDGSDGRSLQTEWIESVVVKYRKPGSAPVAIPTDWNPIAVEEPTF